MAEAYVIDAVRTAVGKRNGGAVRAYIPSTSARPPGAGSSTATTSTPAPSTT